MRQLIWKMNNERTRAGHWRELCGMKNGNRRCHNAAPLVVHRSLPSGFRTVCEMKGSVDGVSKANLPHYNYHNFPNFASQL